VRKIPFEVFTPDDLSRHQGRVEGKFIINKAKKTYMSKFGGDIEKAFDKLTRGSKI